MSPLLLVVGLLGISATVGAFVRLERSDRREAIFVVVVVALVAEMLLNASEADVPRGLFRLDLAGRDIRPPDVLLAAAVLARLLTVTEAPRRISTPALLWGAFLVWYGSAALTGLMRGNPSDALFFQARALLYIGGGYLVASGVRPARLVDARPMGRFTVVVGGAAALLLATAFLGLDPVAGLPGVPIRDLGEALTPDAQLALLMIGITVLVVEAAREQRRVVVALLGVAMLAAPITTTQAGSLVALAVVLVFLVAAALTSTWRRSVRVTATEIGVVAVVLAMLAIPLLAGGGDEGLDPVTNVSTALFSDVQETTTLNRLQLWTDAWDVMRQHPVLGAGLGVEHVLVKEWPTPPVRVGAHNVALDIGARSGLVGFLLFTMALAATVTAGWRAWRGHTDRLLSMLAVGTLLALAGFLARAMVEPSLEKFRHAVLFGLAIGLVSAVHRAYEERRAEAADEPVEIVLEPQSRPRS